MHFTTYVLCAIYFMDIEHAWEICLEGVSVSRRSFCSTPLHPQDELKSGRQRRRRRARKALDEHYNVYRHLRVAISNTWATALVAI